MRGELHQKSQDQADMTGLLRALPAPLPEPLPEPFDVHNKPSDILTNPCFSVVRAIRGCPPGFKS